MKPISNAYLGSHRRTSFVGGFVTILAMGLILAFAVAANAGVVTKHTAGTDVGLTSAWGTGSGPLPATGDVATWSGSSLGGTLTNSIAQTWGAIDIEGATAPLIMNGQPLTLSGGQTINSVANSGLYLAAAGQDLTITNNITNSASMTWTVGSGRTLTPVGKILNLGTYTLTLSGTGTNWVQDSYTGSGNIVVNGPVYIVNSSGSGRSGTTTLNSGTISIFNNSTALGTGALYLNGGTIGSASSAGRTAANAVFIGGDVTFGYSTGTLTFSGGTDLGGANRTLIINADTTFSTIAVANGGIIKAGTNTLTLSTANTFSGGLTVQAGMVSLSSPSAAGTGTVTLGVAGDATSGTLNLSAGTRNIYGLATAGTAANQIIGTSGSSAVTLNYAGATTNTFGGVIEDTLNAGTGTIGVTINNTNAILTLSGANTYTGPTTVTNGTLLVTGSLASTTNSVTVAGGTLGGTGTIGGPTTVNSAGTLTVGGSTGTTMSTLAFGTNLSLAGNTILRLKKGGSPSSDSITSGGTLAFGGTLTLSSVGSTLAANDSFTIFSAGGTGVFASFSPAIPGAGLVWDTSSLNSSGIIKVAALAATITAPAVFPAAVTNTYGTASSPTSVAVSGANLTGNITANAPAGFEVSSDNITYGSTATYVQSGGSASGTLYLRIAATSLVSGSYNSKNVVLTSSGANTVNVATTASGNVVFPKALTVASASVNNRLFDGTTAATIVSMLQTAEAIGSGSSSDGKPYTGDTLTVSGTGTFPTPAVGGPYTVTPSTFTLGGSSATNYTLTQPTGLSLSASILNTAVWTQSAGGSWTNGANWLNNIKATGADNTADFSTLSLTADTTVTLDGSNTVGHLRFDDQSANKYAWTLNTGSKGPLTLAVSSGSPVISNNVATTIGAVIAGTNGLTKTGDWPLIFLNTNTYSGGTEISAGTLQLDTGVTNTATAGTGSIQIDANGTLAFNYGADATNFANLTGTGTIVENGLTTGGAVLLTGTNSFSGLVQINVNKVAFSSATSGNGAPKIAIGPGGTMSLGSGYAGGTLTISELSGSGTVDTKYGATPTGNRTLNINQSSTTTYSGYLLDGGSRYLAITKSGSGTLIISGSANAYTGPTTVSNGTLEVDGTIGYGPTLTFGPVEVNGGMLDGSGTIYGPVTLNSGKLAPATVSGIGTLTINNTLTINGGTVAMRISKTGGSITSDNLAGLTSVTYGGTLTVTNITSDGHLLAAGDTFTLFSGGSSYSGGFATNNLPTLPTGLSWDLSGLTVNGSIAVTANTAPIVFNPTSGGYVGALPVTMTSESGATIHYTTDGSDPTTSGTVISTASPASVTIPVNTVSRTLRAYATKSGKPNTSVSSATYSTVATPTWINPSGGSWSTTGNWSNNVVADDIGVTADFSKLTLSADTTVTLDIPATVGDLTFADQGNAFNWILAVAGNPLTLNGGTNTPIINVVNKNTTIEAVVAGSSGLNKSGTGTLTLTGNNTYSGGTEISAGTLQIANGTGSTATAGTGSIQIDANGTLIFNYGATQDSFGNNLTGTGTIIQNGPNELGLTGVNSFSGLIQINTNNVAFVGANSGNGQPRIAIGSNGLLKLGAGFIGGTLTISELSGAGAINEALTTTSGTRTLNINQGSTTTFSGVMSDSTLSRYLAVIKSGTGTLVLSGPNTYTGATTVSNGTLEVDGQIANSQVTVNGGTLDGSGTIYGPVKLNSGKLAPATAAGIGTLTINNTLTINGGTVAMRISKTGGAVTNDLVAGLNNVTYGGSLVVTNAGPSALAGGEMFQLFSASGSKTGNFTNVTILPVTGATGTFDPATGTLTIAAAASAPTPTNITYTVTGSQLVLNWPAGQGWQLQSQTNSLSTGLTTNWTTVSGATPPFTNTITPANPTVFYRLKY